MSGAEVLVPILVPLSACALIFGIVYLKTRQNMAMIEKGMNPKEFANRPAPYRNLKWALLLIGAGCGLLIAYLLDTYLLWTLKTNNPYHDENPAIYFSLIAIGGGLGLFGSYRIEKKEVLDK